jgi:hypothetical protein
MEEVAMEDMEEVVTEKVAAMVDTPDLMEMDMLLVEDMEVSFQLSYNELKITLLNLRSWWSWRWWSWRTWRPWRYVFNSIFNILIHLL